jgi:hypothetical protein
MSTWLRQSSTTCPYNPHLLLGLEEPAVVPDVPVVRLQLCTVSGLACYRDVARFGTVRPFCLSLTCSRRSSPDRSRPASLRLFASSARKPIKSSTDAFAQPSAGGCAPCLLRFPLRYGRVSCRWRKGCNQYSFEHTVIKGELRCVEVLPFLLHLIYVLLNILPFSASRSPKCVCKCHSGLESSSLVHQDEGLPHGVGMAVFHNMF